MDTLKFQGVVWLSTVQGDQLILWLYIIPVKLSLKSTRTGREPNNNNIIICKVVGQFQTFVEQMCLVTEKIWPFNFDSFGI